VRISFFVVVSSEMIAVRNRYNRASICEGCIKTKSVFEKQKAELDARAEPQ
jgi:hypothetical protein